MRSGFAHLNGYYPSFVGACLCSSWCWGCICTCCSRDQNKRDEVNTLTFSTALLGLFALSSCGGGLRCADSFNDSSFK